MGNVGEKVPENSPSRVVIRLLFKPFCCLLIGTALLLTTGYAAEEPTGQIRLLAERGIKPDTASLTTYLERLQPDKNLQAEIATLLRQVSDVDFDTRQAAFRKLSALGEAAKPQLEAARKSEDPEVSLRAGKVLAKLDSADETRRRESINLAVFEVLKSARDPNAGHAILAAIPELTDSDSRDAACEALWACTAAHHADALAKAIEGDHAKQRAAALVALELAGGPDHVEEIAKHLTSEEALMRLAAARALLDRQPREAFEVLIPLTGNEDLEIAWQADALLQLKTGQLVEPAEQQTLNDAWKAWAEKHLASAILDARLGRQRLNLAARRRSLDEKFLKSESVKGGYGRFLYTADNGGKAKVANGKLCIDGDNVEGDQRLFITSQRMIGRDRWPEQLEVTTRLAGERGNNYGWHLGVSVGRIKALFHPGVSQGEFRAETTDSHDYIFSNEDMGFDVETEVMYEMTMRVVRTDQGADFEVTVADMKNVNLFRRRFSVTRAQLGEFNRIGLERSGRTGGDALFDLISIRLGPGRGRSSSNPEVELARNRQPGSGNGLANASAQQSEGNASIDLRLHSVLPITATTHVSSIAFMSDNATFAMPIDDGTVGIFRINPETKTNVAPLTVAQRQKVAALIAGLDSEVFAKRERASQALLGFGLPIETQLREALVETDSLEARSRLHRLLEQIKVGTSIDRIDRIRSFRGLAGTIRSVEYSPDNRKLLVAGYDKHMRIFDSGTHRQLRRIPVDDNVLHATFSPDGRRIFGAMNSKIGIWDAETGQRQATLAAHSGKIFCVDVSADGRWLACSGVPKHVSLWDLKSTQRLHLLEGFGDSVGHLDFSPDGRHLACASEDGTLSVWDVTSGKRLRSLRGHEHEVWHVTYSPDGATIATGGNNDKVVFWNAKSGHVLSHLSGRGRHVAFSPDGQMVVTATYGTTKVWTRRRNQE